MSAAAPEGTGVHATAVVYGESGVVILGESGSGKSALALALIDRAKRAGLFGALIGDDRVWLRAANGRVIAAGAPHMAGLIERRCAGLQTAASEPAAVVRLCVELSGSNQRWPRWPASAEEIVEGVGLPRLKLDSAACATDNALAVDERLVLLTGDRAKDGGISLEQSAAVHKNSLLRLCGRVQGRLKPAPTTDG